MTVSVTELAQLIVRRIITRAQEEPDPVDYFSRAAARIMMLEERAAAFHGGDMEAALIEAGREFGLLVQGVEKR
jgi:hypothetical protein